MWWVSAVDGSLYMGDCRVGDIAATDAQVAAWQAKLASIVPESVSLWQAKAALQNSNLLTAANTAITSLNNPVLNQYWASADQLLRSSPTLASLAQILNLTSAQVDALFIQASQITL